MNRSRSLLLVFGSFICCLLIVVVTYQMLTGSDRSLTFKGFLDWLSDFHPLISDVSFVDHSILDSWGLFDGFRNFLNIFINIFDFALYCVKSAVNLISYATGFVGFLFS